jgi:ABC-type nitrate/sulfonate/bicarbonate transport system substrate-binding protein
VLTLTRRGFVAGTAAAFVAAKPAIVRAAEPLTIGTVPANAIHWAQDVAIDKGFYKQVGFEPQVAAMQSSPQSIQLAITGAYQIATSQPEPFVAAVERGARGLAALSAPMNRADWTLNVARGVKTLGDLKGKLIGVSSLRTSEVWLTTHLLESEGLKKGEFDFITAGLSPAKISALQKGSIAAAVLYQPTAELAIEQGLPALARYGRLRAYPPVLYVVNRDWAAKGDAGMRAARAIQRAHEWLWDPGNRAEAMQILGKYTHREAKILERVYDDYFVSGMIYAKRGEIELGGLDLALADMAQDGEIVKPPAPPATKYVLPRELGGLAV